MPDTSPIPVRRDEVRPSKVKAKADGAAPSTLASVIPAGPRKLIRPRLPAGTAATRYAGRGSTLSPVPVIHGRWNSAVQGESSHAEAFYFQKQIHSKTLMVFVLEDGQQIEGYIEWYDRNCIKVRHGTRTLIYKSSIKYLYKAADNGAL
jgi:sRNA-binding regulator protein Hfq